MKLISCKNFIDIGKWILEQINNGHTRNSIETALQETYGWSDNQIYATTDPYFKEKLYRPKVKNYAKRSV